MKGYGPVINQKLYLEEPFNGKNKISSQNNGTYESSVVDGFDMLIWRKARFVGNAAATAFTITDIEVWDVKFTQ